MRSSHRIFATCRLTRRQLLHQSILKSTSSSFLPLPQRCSLSTSRIRHVKTSKVPVYFSNDPNSPQPQFPVHFAGQSSPLPHSTSVSGWSSLSRSVRWTTYLALALITATAYDVFLDLVEVPYVERKRFELFLSMIQGFTEDPARSGAHIKTTALDTDLIRLGLPTWASIEESSLVLKNDGTDDRVQMAHDVFQALLEKNNLQATGLQMFVMNAPKQFLGSYQPYHITIYSGLFNVHNTPDALAAYITERISSKLLHHSAENINELFLAGILVLETLLLIPVSIASKRSRILTLPFTVLTAYRVWSLGQKTSALRREADELTIRFMHEAGFDPQQMVGNDYKELVMFQSAIEKLDPKTRKVSARQLNSLIKMTEQRKNTVEEWFRKYPERRRIQVGFGSGHVDGSNGIPPPVEEEAPSSPNSEEEPESTSSSGEESPPKSS